jgi:hypothetical protein
VRGAYFDLITDRITYPLFVFCSAVGVFRHTGEVAALFAGFVATFGLFLDKEAVDCRRSGAAGACGAAGSHCSPSWRAG